MILPLRVGNFLTPFEGWSLFLLSLHFRLGVPFLLFLPFFSFFLVFPPAPLFVLVSSRARRRPLSSPFFFFSSFVFPFFSTCFVCYPSLFPSHSDVLFDPLRVYALHGSYLLFSLLIGLVNSFRFLLILLLAFLFLLLGPSFFFLVFFSSSLVTGHRLSVALSQVLLPFTRAWAYPLSPMLWFLLSLFAGRWLQFFSFFPTCFIWLPRKCATFGSTASRSTVA